VVKRIDESSKRPAMAVDSGHVPPPGVVGPRVAVVFLQPQCNMHCTFCITEDNFNAITFEQATNLLDALKGGGTVRSVVLGGGEPFDWPHDVMALGRYGRSLGLLMQVGTNGIALPEGFEHLDAFDRYVLPLESVDPGPHNAMRLYRGRHHSIIMDRLESLRTVRGSVTISTVITQRNVEHVVDVGRFLGEYVQRGGNVHAWHLYQFLPIGRGGALNEIDLAIPEYLYQSTCEQAESLGLPFRLYRRSDMYHSRTVEFFWVERGRVRWGGEAREPAATLTVHGR